MQNRPPCNIYVSYGQGQCLDPAFDFTNSLELLLVALQQTKVMCRVHSVVLWILVAFEVCSLMLVLAFQGPGVLLAYVHTLICLV